MPRIPKLARKLVEVVPSPDEKFHTTYEDARRIASFNPHRWEGDRRLILLVPNRNIGVTWGVRQSGYAGPLVLQVVA